MKVRTLVTKSVVDIGDSTVVSLNGLGYTFKPNNQRYEIKISKGLAKIGVALNDSEDRVVFPNVKGGLFVIITRDDDAEQYIVRELNAKSGALLLASWEEELEFIQKRIEKVIATHGKNSETQKFLTVFATRANDLKNIVKGMFLIIKTYFEEVNLEKMLEEIKTTNFDDKNDDTEE